MTASLLFNWDAENGTVGQKPPPPLTAVTGPNIPLIAASPVFGGSKSYEVLLDKSQPTILGAVQNPYRTEMRGDFKLQFDRIYWIGFAFRREEWGTDTSAENFPIQIHEAPSDWTNWGKGDCQQSAASTAPLVCISKNGQMSLKNLTATLWTKPVDIGVWHTVVLQVKISQTANGFIRSWYDGVEQPRYPASGFIKTHRANSELNAACTPIGQPTVVFITPLVALGVYKWDWKIGSTQTSLTTRRRAYIDQFKAAEDVAGNDDSGGYAMVNPGGAPDTTPPTISGISVSDVSTTAATVNFTTNEAATTIIDYGLFNTYGSVYSNTSLVTSHVAAITGLTHNTTYNYRIRTTDISGNTQTSANGTFTTDVDVTTVSPIITNVVAVPTHNDATVTWTTNEASTSRVLFMWDSGASSFAIYDAASVTSHSITASTESILPVATVVDFKISSVDVDGNQTDYFGQFTTAVDPVEPALTVTDIVLSLVNGYIQVAWNTNKAATSVVTINGVGYKVAGLSTTHTVRGPKAKFGEGTFSVTSATAADAETVSVSTETFTVSATISRDLQ